MLNKNELKDQSFEEYPNDPTKPKNTISYQELAEIKQLSLQSQLIQLQLENSQYEMQLFIARLYIKYGVDDTFILSPAGEFINKK